MSDAKYVRAEEQGETLVIVPMFTYASLIEPGIANEWKTVRQRIESPSVRNLLIDLGEIPYFGSTMLEWMSQMWKLVKAKGGKVAIGRASPIGREVLGAARFDKLWGIFETREQALDWLVGPHTQA